MQSTVTDEVGRYGFLISEDLAQKEPMHLRAYLTKYTFPALAETSAIEKQIYPNIYKGGVIDTGAGVTNYDLPLDPVNKFRGPNFYFGIISIGFNNLLTTLASLLFIVGVILGVLNFVFYPNKITFAVLVFIFITYLLRSSGFRLKPFGLTRDRDTQQKMPFGLISLHNKISGERVNFTVSDDKGRYFMLTKKGKYLLKAYTPSHIVPMRTKEIPMLADRGWVSQEVVL